MELAEAIIQTIIIAATPLAFAALGEAVAEKSGVLNLGVEGMMIVGALAGFAVTLESGSHVAGVVAAAGAGVAAALVFGMLTQFLLSNQVATGSFRPFSFVANRKCLDTPFSIATEAFKPSR